MTPAPRLERTAAALWVPLVAVIAVLAVLAIVPLGVSLAVRHLRTAISEVVDPARLHTTDLAASLAEEMFAVGMQPKNGSAQPLFRSAHDAEHRDALALDSLLRFVGADAVELFAQYREAVTRWHDDVGALAVPGGSSLPLDTARTDGTAALDAVRRLDELLDSVAMTRRASAARLERVDTELPVVLVPLALVACVLIVRAGRQLADGADRAERDARALTAAAEQRNALMRGISHDLQNPLGAALGHLELVLDGVVRGEDERPALIRVRRLVASASDSVVSLLEIARGDGSDVRLAASEVDLNALAEAAVDDHRPLALSRDLRISVEKRSDCSALADAARVRHILDNLLSNGLKYTPRGGRVCVLVDMRDHDGRTWCSVSVEDTGPGVPMGWRERVFEEFARVPQYSELAPGNGIGLAVSRRVARLMGGELLLEPPLANSPDATVSGARFTLLLPAAG